MMDHVSRQPNGAAVGVWGRHLLRSAFQPIYAFVHGKLQIAAYEGLIRPFEDGEPRSPGEFFGPISAMDRFRVETLTRTLHVLNAKGVIGPTASLFLNFDPSVFTQPAIADNALKDLRLGLHEAGIDAARVVCEMTEKKSASDDTLFSFVQALRSNGLKVAVDDYGADDSDINRIRELRPDIVKFDAAWITRLMESDPGAALLTAMVSQFRSMGIRTVFEGLEEGWQLDLAESCGVDMVQGYILAKPELVSIDALPASETRFEPSETPGQAPEAVRPLVPVHMPGRHVKPFGRRGLSP